MAGITKSTVIPALNPRYVGDYPFLGCVTGKTRVVAAKNRQERLLAAGQSLEFVFGDSHELKGGSYAARSSGVSALQMRPSIMRDTWNSS